MSEERRKDGSINLTSNQESKSNEHQDKIPGTKMANRIVELLEERKTDDISLIPITERSSLADYFILASINSTPQGRTTAEHIIEKLDEEFSRKPIRTEGLDTVRWILLDYGDIVVHLFHYEERDYYSLEKLWTREEPVDADTLD